MPRAQSIHGVLMDAQKIQDTWAENPGFQLGEVTLASFKTSRQEFADAAETTETKRIELQGLANNRDDRMKALQTLITRARSGFRAAYGSDSSQYDQAGGTRRSERKPKHRVQQPGPVPAG